MSYSDNAPSLTSHNELTRINDELSRELSYALDMKAISEKNLRECEKERLDFQIEYEALTHALTDANAHIHSLNGHLGEKTKEVEVLEKGNSGLREQVENRRLECEGLRGEVGRLEEMGREKDVILEEKLIECEELREKVEEMWGREKFVVEEMWRKESLMMGEECGGLRGEVEKLRGDNLELLRKNSRLESMEKRVLDMAKIMGEFKDSFHSGTELISTTQVYDQAESFVSDEHQVILVEDQNIHETKIFEKTLTSVPQTQNLQSQSPCVADMIDSDDEVLMSKRLKPQLLSPEVVIDRERRMSFSSAKAQ